MAGAKATVAAGMGVIVVTVLELEVAKAQVRLMAAMYHPREVIEALGMMMQMAVLLQSAGAEGHGHADTAHRRLRCLIQWCLAHWRRPDPSTPYPSLHILGLNLLGCSAGMPWWWRPQLRTLLI